VPTLARVTSDAATRASLALQASDAQQQIQPKDEDKKE
jgi:hypothetical protein